MSIAKHHAEWLSLMEISGPFLSMPVLLDTFPQGLDAHDPDHAQLLRAAYEEWADNQSGLAPDPAIHHAWIRFVLGQTLELPDELLAEGQAIPESVKAVLAEHGETMRPDMMVVDPDSRQPRLLIHIYPAAQDLEKVVHGRNWKASPAMRMMELLHSTEVRLGLVTNGERWLLVQAKRGETTGFISWYAGLWLEEKLTLRAFRTLLGVARFFGVPDEQTLPALLDASAQDQQEVTDQLGYQVRRAVEILIQAIDRADQDRGRTLLIGVDEARLYEAALTVMMRLVFLLSAEERGLLLLGDPIYDQNYAVSTLRARLRGQADQFGEEVLERSFDAWSRLLATFRAVHGGVRHENMRLPAYGGSLFDPDRFPFLEGRHTVSREPLPESGEPLSDDGIQNTEYEPRNTEYELSAADPLPIHNRTVLHLLEALQILQVRVPGGGGAEARRLSFRALDIEQIGHVYEGLLDHQAVRAAEPVLGLAGTRDKEPEVPLSRLEAFLVSGEQLSVNSEQYSVSSEEKLLDFLQAETGRSRSALQKALENDQQPTDYGQRLNRLRVACGNDEALYRRVLPWAGLVRDDDYGWPVVIPAGSVYVTAGATRRATGTHYTPRSLTEPIVQHTLEPLVYEGPAEGWPREKWQLRAPKALLALKVCDMAMGSGAFLVQACRYLSERLVEAWGSVSSEQDSVNGEGTVNTEHRILNTALQITPEGTPATGDPNETILPEDDEERLALARRLVVDRCLYGVDKNHLAVEMAKLSLWLVTLDKNRPFTFLDHALRHGDSLIGADEEMFLRWAHGLQDSSMPLFDQEIRRLVSEAKAKRQALQSFAVRDVGDAEEKARLLAEAEAATARIKLGCDLLVGARLLDDLKPKEQDALLANGLLDYIAGQEWQDANARRAVKAAQSLPAFHWPFEFPEVFAEGGFSAFVGNPPFMWGNRISTYFGDNYRDWLLSTRKNMLGNADLCAHFFRRSYDLLVSKGVIGFISTNSISETDNRTSSLEPLTKFGAKIINARPNFKWPGHANLHVTTLIIFKGHFKGKVYLDEKPVPYISSYLDTLSGETPFKLMTQSDLSFKGVDTGGLGFVISKDEYTEIAKTDSNSVKLIWPFMNGADLLSSPTQQPSRLIINFSGLNLAKAQTFKTIFDIVKERVWPYRKTVKRKANRENWWLYNETRPGLYSAISKLSVNLVNCVVSKYICFDFVNSHTVFSNALNVFASDSFNWFALLQSTIHESWARYHGSSLETRNRYNPTDCFETFPFPKDISTLEHIGKNYHEYRRQIMLDRQEGLTATYNRFHDPAETAPDIARLRQLHVEMDYAVARAYGWDDLDLGHGFHETPQGIRYTISEPARREVLTRLLRLNHERYEEEVKLGLHEKKGGRKKAKGRRQKKGKPKKNDGQLSLF